MLGQKSKASDPSNVKDRGAADKLDLLLNVAADATVGVDVEGRIVFSNIQANRLSGYSQGELAGRRIEVLLPEVFRSGEFGRRSLFLADPESQAFGEGPQLYAQMKDGTEFPVEIGVSRFKHENIVAIFFIRDVTDLLRAEEALVGSREEFRTVIEHAPNAMMIVDESGQVQLVNAQAEKLFGYSRDELLGQPVDLLVPDKVRKKHPEIRAGYYADPQLRTIGREDKQLFARHKDGNEIPVEITVSPLETEDGTMVVASVNDLSIRHRKEQELKKAFAEIELLKSQLEEENVQLKEEVAIAHGFHHIVGDSPALRNCLEKVSVVAATDVSVLILGETGTGKELIARAIHDLSSRKDRRLVTVNCAALPQELVESELFGHEKGAFTDAREQRKGRFEIADGGTLFLDEIGELPLQQQTKLLRVLQEGTFERLGGNETIHVDVRLIAATNRQLKQSVADNEFRADLFYRINTYPIDVPSLDERKDDIPLLAEHFLRKHAPRLKKSVFAISKHMLSHLQARTWSGNVRELESYIVRCLVSSNGSELTPWDEGESDWEVPASEVSGRENELSDLVEFERNHVLAVLERRGWVIGGEKGAAAALGLAPSTLRSRMKQLGIKRSESVPAD